MTVFKTFLKILNKNKSVIIMYTAILVFFGIFNMQTSDTNTGFKAEKPDILIINNDEYTGITKNMIDYIEKNSNKVEIKNDEESINDALFYRDVNYIIYIPKDYRKAFLSGKVKEIQVKKTGDYQASLAEITLKKYLKIASAYKDIFTNEDSLIKNINNTLKDSTNVKLMSKLDTNSLDKAAYFYNFSNYSILAGCVYVICLILSSFYETNVRKRTIISSMNHKKYNRILLLSNGLFACFLWALYVLVSFILIGNVMFSVHGILFIINSFIFTICSLTLALLIGNITSNKDALNGIINVIALGSSFLCGAFVPAEFLPDIVISIAHLLPSYYFINSNELVTGLESISFSTLTPILKNMGIIILFIILFIIITNIISRKKRIID